MSFKPNDKVVCVDAKRRASSDLHRVHGWVQEGCVYCVRSVVQSPFTGKWGVRVVGISADVSPLLNLEYAFYADRFRIISEVGHPEVRKETNEAEVRS